MTACYGDGVDTGQASRFVVVDQVALGDLLDLVERAHREIAMQDPTLADALRGSVAQVQTSAVPEP